MVPTLERRSRGHAQEVHRVAEHRDPRVSLEGAPAVRSSRVASTVVVAASASAPVRSGTKTRTSSGDRARATSAPPASRGGDRPHDRRAAPDSGCRATRRSANRTRRRSRRTRSSRRRAVRSRCSSPGRDDASAERQRRERGRQEVGVGGRCAGTRAHAARPAVEDPGAVRVVASTTSALPTTGGTPCHWPWELDAPALGPGDGVERRRRSCRAERPARREREHGPVGEAGRPAPRPGPSQVQSVADVAVEGSIVAHAEAARHHDATIAPHVRVGRRHRGVVRGRATSADATPRRRRRPSRRTSSSMRASGGVSAIRRVRRRRSTTSRPDEATSQSPTRRPARSAAAPATRWPIPTPGPGSAGSRSRSVAPRNPASDVGTATAREAPVLRSWTASSSPRASADLGEPGPAPGPEGSRTDTSASFFASVGSVPSSASRTSRLPRRRRWARRPGRPRAGAGASIRGRPGRRARVSLAQVARASASASARARPPLRAGAPSPSTARRARPRPSARRRRSASGACADRPPPRPRASTSPRVERVDEQPRARATPRPCPRGGGWPPAPRRGPRRRAPREGRLRRSLPRAQGGHALGRSPSASGRRSPSASRSPRTATRPVGVEVHERTPCPERHQPVHEVTTTPGPWRSRRRANGRPEARVQGGPRATGAARRGRRARRGCARAAVDSRIRGPPFARWSPPRRGGRGARVDFRATAARRGPARRPRAPAEGPQRAARSGGPPGRARPPRPRDREGRAFGVEVALGDEHRDLRRPHHDPEVARAQHGAVVAGPSGSTGRGRPRAPGPGRTPGTRRRPQRAVATRHHDAPALHGRPPERSRHPPPGPQRALPRATVPSRPARERGASAATSTRDAAPRSSSARSTAASHTTARPSARGPTQIEHLCLGRDCGGASTRSSSSPGSGRWRGDPPQATGAHLEGHGHGGVRRARRTTRRRGREGHRWWARACARAGSPPPRGPRRRSRQPGSARTQRTRPSSTPTPAIVPAPVTTHASPDAIVGRSARGRLRTSGLGQRPRVLGVGGHGAAPARSRSRTAGRPVARSRHASQVSTSPRRAARTTYTRPDATSGGETTPTSDAPRTGWVSSTRPVPQLGRPSPRRARTAACAPPPRVGGGARAGRGGSNMPVAAGARRARRARDVDGEHRAHGAPRASRTAGLRRSRGASSAGWGTATVRGPSRDRARRTWRSAPRHEGRRRPTAPPRSTPRRRRSRAPRGRDRDRPAIATTGTPSRRGGRLGAEARARPGRAWSRRRIDARASPDVPPRSRPRRAAGPGRPRGPSRAAARRAHAHHAVEIEERRVRVHQAHGHGGAVLPRLGGIGAGASGRAAGPPRADVPSSRSRSASTARSRASRVTGERGVAGDPLAVPRRASRGRLRLRRVRPTARRSRAPRRRTRRSSPRRGRATAGSRADVGPRAAQEGDLAGRRGPRGPARVRPRRRRADRPGAPAAGAAAAGSARRASPSRSSWASANERNGVSLGREGVAGGGASASRRVARRGPSRTDRSPGAPRSRPMAIAASRGRPGSPSNGRARARARPRPRGAPHGGGGEVQGPAGSGLLGHDTPRGYHGARRTRAPGPRGPPPWGRPRCAVRGSCADRRRAGLAVARRADRRLRGRRDRRPARVDRGAGPASADGRRRGGRPALGRDGARDLAQLVEGEAIELRQELRVGSTRGNRSGWRATWRTKATATSR